MISLSFLAHYNSIFVLIALIILVYGGLKVINFKGNNFVLALLSFLVAFMFVSSDKLVSYIAELLPILLVIAIVIFCVLLVVTFGGDSIPGIKHGLVIAGLAIGIIVVVIFTFSFFSPLFHFLPATSNAGLSSGLSDLKNYLYSGTIRDSIVFIISVVAVGILLLKK